VAARNFPSAKIIPARPSLSSHGTARQGQRQERLRAPDEKHINTSYVERQNLTMRMSMRRFTRLTNGFSKKFENHCHSISLHMFYYNFVRVHQTIRRTPAMAAGVTDRQWTMLDVVGLIESAECEAAQAGGGRWLS